MKWLILFIPLLAMAEDVQIVWKNTTKDVKGNPTKISSTRLLILKDGKNNYTYIPYPTNTIAVDIQPCTYLSISHVSNWGIVSNPAPMMYKVEYC